MNNKETLIKHIEDIPKLRFPEFEEKWKEILLSEIADKVVDKNNNLQYKEIFTNSAEYGVVSQKDFFVNDIITPVNLNKYYIVKENDFVYNPRISNSAPVGPININKLNKIGIMSPLYLIFHTHDIDTIYLENFFKSNHWHSYMLFNGNSGARLDRFSIKDSVFFDMQIFVPSYLEQQKIGTFLSKVDSLIRLYENKLNILNKYKKGVLREIYSNIKEYDYVSLKEISIICNGYAFNAKDYKKEGLYNIITITNVQGNKYIDNLNKCNRIRSIPDNINSYQILNENDILISMTGNVGRVSLNKGNNNLLNQRVCKIDNISKNVNKEYLFQILRNNKFEEFMTNLGKGANQKNISKSDIENYMIKLPDLNIQNKIANILSTYDNLIDKEKQVLNRLQEMKSGLLQQMFI